MTLTSESAWISQSRNHSGTSYITNQWQMTGYLTPGIFRTRKIRQKATEQKNCQNMIPSLSLRT